MKKLLDLKIGRHTYEIDGNDEFMDNGNCVQLLTQSKEKSDWGRKPNPVLSRRADKEIAGFLRLYVEGTSIDSKVKLFKLGLI